MKEETYLDDPKCKRVLVCEADDTAVLEPQTLVYAKSQKGSNVLVAKRPQDELAVW